GPSVVVTHHPASPLAADAFRGAPGVPWWVPAFYATTVLDDLPDAMRPRAWVSGHFHAGHDLRIGRCRWVANPVEGTTFRVDARIDL
ncbi:metallophosphoesterase, partial [Methylobacterium trifolii]